jgi:hypothetical protein
VVLKEEGGSRGRRQSRRSSTACVTYGREGGKEGGKEGHFAVSMSEVAPHYQNCPPTRSIASTTNRKVILRSR